MMMGGTFGSADTLAQLSCANGEIAKRNGAAWACAADDAGLAALQGQDDSGACTLAKDGLIKFNPADNPPWQYCDGGTTSWLPFRLPQCQNDGTGECTLSALRSADDPQFKASAIRCGDNVLGVIGTYGNGSSSAFTFADVNDAALSTLTTASAVTISGIPAGCSGEVSVAGDGSPEISIAGGAWGTSGNITNGQTLAVRLTSSAAFGSAHTATISIGSTDDEWVVTTVAADTTPNAFTFTDVTNAEPSTLTTSNTITITGINTTTPVSVTGTGAQISINGGAWGTSGNITNGQTLAVRLTSSASFATAMTATVNVGGVTDNWSVTTRAAANCANTTMKWTNASTGPCQAASLAMTHGQNKSVTNTASGYTGTRNLSCNDGTISQSGGSCTGTDSTPNAFSITNQTGVAPNTLIYSNTVSIIGLTTGASVSISGQGAPQFSIAGGAWTTSGTIQNGQTLRLRLTSANAYSTTRTATVNVGGVTDTWSVTTRAVANCVSKTFTSNAGCDPISTGNMTHNQNKVLQRADGECSNDSSSWCDWSGNVKCNNGVITAVAGGGKPALKCNRQPIDTGG